MSKKSEKKDKRADLHLEAKMKAFKRTNRKYRNALKELAR